MATRSTARLKEIAKDADYADERKQLTAYAAVLDQQATAKTKLKAAQEALDKMIDAKYPAITEAEIKILVVDDKWMAPCRASWTTCRKPSLAASANWPSATPRRCQSLSVK